MTRTFGIEEEFFIVDPATGAASPMSGELSHQLLGEPAAGTSVHRELLACQLEVVTDICSSAHQALDALVERRALIERICLEHGVIPFASGTILQIPAATQFTEGSRYAKIHDFVPGIAREHFINGLHIHVHVPDADDGVKALNALRSWLPLLVAMGANSPIWNGQRSGFESWRAVHYRRWSAVGIPPSFASAQDYAQHLSTMISSGALLDPGHVGWFARLSEKHPTIEVRAADTQMTARESVTLALIIRAIVDAALAEDPGTNHLPTQWLELSLWQGAKVGMSGPFFYAESGLPLAPGTQLERLLAYCGKHLQRNADEEFVVNYLEALSRQGNGAARQRASWNEGGAVQVVADAAELFSRR